MRPRPPEILIDEEYQGIIYFIPAPELDRWIRKVFLDELSKVYNEEHIHLTRADFRSIWTNVPNVKGQMRIAATAEMPFIRGSAWSKARQEMQFQEWFGGIPDFLLTFDARLAVEANDLQFTARVDHELYHCAQARDKFNQPMFNDAGQPKFGMKGHDVEEHTGIMRRYGPHGCAGDTIAFLEAAERMPEIGEVEILGACGTCGR